MSTSENGLTNLNHRNDAISRNIDINNLNKLFPQKNIKEKKSSINSEEQEVNLIGEKNTKSNDKSSKSIQNNKKSGHHNIYINTNDDQKKDNKQKGEQNKSQLKATESFLHACNFTQDQYEYLLKLGDEFNNIELTFEKIIKKRDDDINKAHDELEKKHQAKMDKYNNDLAKLKPLDIEVKSRSGEYENFLIKILNRISLDENGKATTDLCDFLANVQDINDYRKQLSKIANDPQTPVEQKNELTKLSLYLAQTSALAGSIDGTTEATMAINKILTDYNLNYNTRSLPHVWLDYLIGFLASMFNMFSSEHSYKVYNENFIKMKTCIAKLNSQNTEEAQQAREEFLEIYNKISLEQTYSVGKELDQELYQKLIKIKNTIINEKDNIDNTDLLKKLIKVGGKFDISNIMNNIGTQDRENFEKNLKTFVENNILPKDIIDKDKYANAFIHSISLDKIDNMDDDTKKKLEDEWGGKIAKNQSIFSKKKYADDTLSIEVNQEGYTNRFVQDKIDAITTANIQCWGDYQDFCKQQLQKYNILIGKLNFIQQNTKLSVEPAYRNIINNIKQIFDKENFKKFLVNTQEVQSDLYDSIMTKEQLEEYKNKTKEVRKNLTDKATQRSKSGKYTSYAEIQEQLDKVKDIKSVIQDNNKTIKSLKVDPIKQSDIAELNRNVKTIDELEATTKRYDKLINEKTTNFFKALQPMNLEHFNTGGRRMGGSFGGYPPYDY